MLIDQKWKAAWSEIKSCQNVLHIKSKLFRFFRCFEVLFQAFAVKTVEKSLHMQPLFVSVPQATTYQKHQKISPVKALQLEPLVNDYLL